MTLKTVAPNVVNIRVDTSLLLKGSSINNQNKCQAFYSNKTTTTRWNTHNNTMAFITLFTMAAGTYYPQKWWYACVFKCVQEYVCFWVYVFVDLSQSYTCTFADLKPPQTWTRWNNIFLRYSRRLQACITQSSGAMHACKLVVMYVFDCTRRPVLHLCTSMYVFDCTRRPVLHLYSYLFCTCNNNNYICAIYTMCALRL